MMIIRHTKTEDLDDVLKIYAAARQYMKNSGNATQWGDTHPAPELIEGDIKNGTGYVCEVDGKVHGVFALIFGEDPTYPGIEGKWRNSRPYATIHRIASDGQVHGIAKACFDFAASQIDDLRGDTHENNLTMQHCFESYGFERCGIIYVADGTPRIAYHYVKEK